MERVRSALEAAGCRKGAGQDWQCPAHEDRQASLSVTEGRDSKAILKCHADCRTEDVLAALGLGWADLFPGDRKPKAEIVATYDYTDPDGKLLYQAVRYFPKAFKRRRPDGNGGWVWTLSKPDGKPAVRKVLYRLPKVLETARAGGAVYIVEGEKDAHALERDGATATTILGGAEAPWLSAYTKALDGADVAIIADHDEAGHRFARRVAGELALAGIPTQLLRAAKGKDAADHLAAGLGLDELVPLEEEPDQQPAPTLPPPPPPQQRTLAQVEAVFGKWLAGNDHTPLHAVLATYVANMHLDGDPVWLVVVAGSSGGKTEHATSLARLPNVTLVSTIASEAALLSGTVKRERASDATGGLLLEAGPDGVLVIKDFTTILSLHREARAQVIAALREVADGYWSRRIGGEGGRVLSWNGKLGMVACSTTALDQAHAVISVMGDRYIMVRISSGERRERGARALKHRGREATMRAELAEAVAGLLAGGPPEAPHELSDEVSDQLVALADLVTLARSPVSRDYKGEIEFIHDPEAPTRFIKQLAQLYRACGSIGLDQAAAWKVARRVAVDSIPKLRRLVFNELTTATRPATTTEMALAVKHPTKTVKRALEDLEAHGVLDRISQGQGKADLWSLSAQAKGLWDDAAAAAEGEPETSDPAHSIHESSVLGIHALSECKSASDDISGLPSDGSPPLTDADVPGDLFDGTGYDDPGGWSR